MICTFCDLVRTSDQTCAFQVKEKWRFTFAQCTFQLKEVESSSSFLPFPAALTGAGPGGARHTEKHEKSRIFRFTYPPLIRHLSATYPPPGDPKTAFQVKENAPFQGKEMDGSPFFCSILLSSALALRAAREPAPRRATHRKTREITNFQAH